MVSGVWFHTFSLGKKTSSTHTDQEIKVVNFQKRQWQHVMILIHLKAYQQYIMKALRQAEAQVSRFSHVTNFPGEVLHYVKGNSHDNLRRLI